MSLDRNQLWWGLLAAVVAGCAATCIGALAWWPDSDDDPQPQVVAEAELSPPMDAPLAWADEEADERIEIDLDDDPKWWAQDSLIIEGPLFEGWDGEWTRRHVGDWSVASGVYRGNGVHAFVHQWTAPGFPMVIVDIDARLSADAAAEPLETTTTVKSDDAAFLTDALDGKTSRHRLDDQAILAARFESAGPVVQLHAPDGASGRIVEDDSDDVTINWTVWPGSSDVSDCLDEASGLRSSLRLVVGFGDHPLVAPLPAPPEATAVGTPVFIDPPATTDDPWVDGRARSPRDLADRFRTLAFGHSDRDDPRYGNGGLLAAEMGAVFVIPSRWWAKEPIEQLRNTLDDTGIEVLPETPVGDASDHRLAFAGEDHCSTRLTSSDDDYTTAQTVVTIDGGHSAFDTGLATPLPPTIEVGQAPGQRDVLLEQLVGDSLFSPGSRRARVFPVQATRNPLEDVFDDTLLSPERHGHWNLHEALTRQLTARELDPESSSRPSLSFTDMMDRRNGLADALPHWRPDHTVAVADPSSPPLYAFGITDQLDVAAVRTTSDITTWHHDHDDPATYGASIDAVEFEWRP